MKSCSNRPSIANKGDLLNKNEILRRLRDSAQRLEEAACSISMVDGRLLRDIAAEIRSVEDAIARSGKTESKRRSAQKAALKKKRVAAEKIENAIRLLLMTGEDVTARRIHEESGVAYSTVLRHLKESQKHKKYQAK